MNVQDHTFSQGVFSLQKSSCTVADRSFSVGTIGEILEALVNVSGGQRLAGRLSNRLLPVLVAGIRDSDPEVRNNSVFGLGCLAEAAGPIVVTYLFFFCLACVFLCECADATITRSCSLVDSAPEIIP